MTGQVENVGMTPIFQDFLKWEPIPPRTLRFGHTFQPLSSSTARAQLHCNNVTSMTEVEHVCVLLLLIMCFNKMLDLIFFTTEAQ